MIYHRKFNHQRSKTWVVFIHGAGGSNGVWFRQLKEFKKHFKFVGGEIVGEFLMSIGILPGAHGKECDKYRG